MTYGKRKLTVGGCQRRPGWSFAAAPTIVWRERVFQGREEMRMRRNRTEVRAVLDGAPARLALAAGVLAVLALALLTGGASAAPGPQAFGPGSSYSALIDPASAPAGFEAPAFDDSSWPTPSAPFGFNEAHCGFPTVTTAFPLGSTGYFRKHFDLPANAFGVHLLGTVDNDAGVWVNGHAQGAHIDSGSCQVSAIDRHVPNADLNHGGGNVAALKIVDDGSTTSYFDLQATYGVLGFGQQPTEVEKASAIAPAPTVQITDADGNPVSGASVTITLQTILGTGTLSGTTTVATDATGLATFSNLKVSAAGTYRLVATSEGASDTSDAFVIADDVAACNGPCSAQGAQGGTSTQAATNTQNGALAVAVFTSSPPTGVCDGLVSLG